MTRFSSWSLTELRDCVIVCDEGLFFYLKSDYNEKKYAITVLLFAVKGKIFIAAGLPAGCVREYS